MSFDNAASNWDNPKRMERAAVISDEIEEKINPNKNYSAMEFGCGTGLISFNLYNKFKKVTLIDSSKGMMDVIKSKIEKYGVKNMFPEQLDIFKNLPQEKFDVIYTSMVLHHIKDTTAIIDIFYKLLNDKGSVCIVDLNEEDGSFHGNNPDFDGHNGFNQEEFKKLLENSGFKDVQSETFFYGKKRVEDRNVDYSLFVLTGRK